MNIKYYLNEKLENVFNKLGYDTKFANVAFSTNNLADIQCNASFALAKILHKSPIEVADELIANMQELKKILI